MPQIFQVLKCYKCSVFQVHQTKKLNKWICKMCGEKQSIKRHYGIGNGKECRLHVQKLNGIRGNIDELKNQSQDSTDDDEMLCKENIKQSNNEVMRSMESKWSKYDYNQKDHSQLALDETMYFNDMEVVLEFPKKRCRKFITKYNINKDVLEPNLKNNKNLWNEEKNVLDKSKHTIMKSEKNINSSDFEIEFKYKLNNTVLLKNVEQNIHENSVSPKMKKESKWLTFIDIDSDDNEVIKNHDENLHKYYKSDKKSSHSSICNDNKSINFEIYSNVNLCNEAKLLKDSKHKDIPECLTSSITKKEYTQCCNTNTMTVISEITAYNDEYLSPIKNQTLFSLCDDNDLDELLNI